MKHPRVFHVLACLGVFSVLCATASAQVQMLAVEFDTGDVYGVSMGDASLTYLGSTGLVGLGSLEFAPDGTLYAFTTGTTPTLYELAPGNFAPSEIGPLGLDFIFDGSLVFASTGIVYGTNRGTTTDPDLFTLDMSTGAATIVGTIAIDSASRADINAMAWRNDGVLVGLDRISNSLVEIDPADGSGTALAGVTPSVGGVGGMAVWDDVGYFATAGPGAFPGGSNELYSFNLDTGVQQFIGSFGGTITSGSGIAGLAVVPEPMSLALLAAGGLLMIRRRRR